MKKVETPKAPKAIGPYSQAVESNGFVFCSGQIAIDPQTNEFIGRDIDQQTKRVIENLKIVLEGAGSSLAKAVKVNVFMTDLSEFPRMNEIFSSYFSHKPARATIQAAGLPKGARIEMDVVAEK